MSKLGRVLLILALALAVQAQAMSAVMAGICMANDYHAGAVHSHDGDEHHFHDQDAASEHAGDANLASSAQCPPCVACCAAAAISSARSGFLPEGPAAGPVVAAPEFAAGFQPDGVYRPPLAL